MIQWLRERYWRLRGWRVLQFEAKVTRADGRVEIYRQRTPVKRVIPGIQ